MFKNRKGMAVSMDFILSVLLAGMLLILFITEYNLYIHRLDDRINYQRYEFMSTAITQSLIMDSGSPKNWENNSENVENIGLAITPRILSPDKVETFSEMDYEVTKEKLRISGMDYTFRIYYPNGSIIAEQGEAVLKKSIVAIERTVVLNNQSVIMEFSLRK